MWEYWRTDKARGKTRHRSKQGGDGSPRSGERSDSGTPRLTTEGSSVIHFKDAILHASEDEDELTDLPTKLQVNLRLAQSEQQMTSKQVKQKLIIILVGLPARGKTFLCNKLMCYLNWLGHETRHFNIGRYRRMQSHGSHKSHDASFFDNSNAEGRAQRAKALNAALDDMEAWLRTDEAQVAICDATNSTNERRDYLRDRLHGRWQYLFIESIVTDTAVLEQNYKYKMMYSPDYRDQDPEQALADFKERIEKYEMAYETMTDRRLHYIKLTDMVTGQGHMDINRISGYIPGKIVFFLLQVCRANGRPRKIWLTRHGESEYNRHGKLGGDPPLSALGKEYAKMLPDVVVERTPATQDGESRPVIVWSSTLQRTIQTAERLPFPKLRWKVLDEIQAGIFDGWTYAEIEKQRPEEFAARKKDKLSYRYPSGESYRDVIARLETVIIELERERECVCVVAHQAVLRALYGYFTDTPLHEIPSLEFPLHTLVELTPKPDGKMSEHHIKFDVKNKRHAEPISFTRVSSRVASSRMLGLRSSMDVPFLPLPALSSPRLNKSTTNPDLEGLASEADDDSSSSLEQRISLLSASLSSPNLTALIDQEGAIIVNRKS